MTLIQVLLMVGAVVLVIEEQFAFAGTVGVLWLTTVVLTEFTSKKR